MKNAVNEKINEVFMNHKNSGCTLNAAKMVNALTLNWIYLHQDPSKCRAWEDWKEKWEGYGMKDFLLCSGD